MGFKLTAPLDAPNVELSNGTKRQTQTHLGPPKSSRLHHFVQKIGPDLHSGFTKASYGELCGQMAMAHQTGIGISLVVGDKLASRGVCVSQTAIFGPLGLEKSLFSASGLLLLVYCSRNKETAPLEHTIAFC